jgi:hypothetical protein
MLQYLLNMACFQLLYITVYIIVCTLLLYNNLHICIILQLFIIYSLISAVPLLKLHFIVELQIFFKTYNMYGH